MKKTFLLLLTCFIGGNTLLAQQETDSTVINMTEAQAPHDSVIVYNNMLSREITNENGVQRHKWSLNFLSIESTQHTGRHASHWGHSSNFGPDRIYIGFTEMVPDGFDIKPGGCWEWGFSLMRFQTWHPSGRFGFNTALYLSRSSYRIKGDDAFHTTPQGLTVCDDALHDELHYHRQRLIHWSWRLPVEMYVKTKGGLHYTAGIEGELRHHVRSRAKVGKKNKYYIDRNGLDVEAFGYNALFGFGTESFTIFGRYNISDFFGSKSLVDAQPFTIAINFNLD